MFPLHLDILPVGQQALLPFLAPLRDNWYLAGGTALALQIGHRESIDFDFFCPLDFDTAVLMNELLTLLPECQKIYEESNTLYITSSGIKCSFIHYPYPLIATPEKTDSLTLAGLPDIAAMKLSAIQQRSTQKDYIDLYFLLQRFSFGELLEFYNQKFGTITSDSLLRKYLVYFDDIEPVDIRMHSDISWEDMKKGLIKSATDF